MAENCTEATDCGGFELAIAWMKPAGALPSFLLAKICCAVASP